MTVNEELARFERDGDYLDQHYEELLEQYPEQWVAIYNQRVVAHAKDIWELVRQVREGGIPPGDIFQSYLTKNPPEWILLGTPPL